MGGGVSYERGTPVGRNDGEADLGALGVRAERGKSPPQDDVGAIGRARLGMTLKPLLDSTALYREDVSWNTSSELGVRTLPLLLYSCDRSWKVLAS